MSSPLKSRLLLDSFFFCQVKVVLLFLYSVSCIFFFFSDFTMRYFENSLCEKFCKSKLPYVNTSYFFWPNKDLEKDDDEHEHRLVWTKKMSVQFKGHFGGRGGQNSVLFWFFFPLISSFPSWNCPSSPVSCCPLTAHGSDCVVPLSSAWQCESRGASGSFTHLWPRAALSLTLAQVKWSEWWRESSRNDEERPFDYFTQTSKQIIKYPTKTYYFQIATGLTLFFPSL